MTGEVEILKNAYVLAAISSATFGVIGAFVVARRIGYLTGAIAHCAFGGVGIGLWFSRAFAGVLGARASTLFESQFPEWTALAFALVAALLVDWTRRRAKEREETLLGVIWAFGTAIGLLFIDRVPGYASATTYLFGDVLLATSADVGSAAVLGAVILSLVALNFKKLEAVCFDEEFAELRGVNAAAQNRLLLVLTAAAVVMMTRVIGLALVVAMLTLPAATACRFTKRLSTTIVASIAACFVATTLGLKISYMLNFSSGPTIILVAATFYVVALVASSVARRVASR